MSFAIEEAEKASDLGEVPVGAVVVLDGEVISRSGNRRETLNDPTAHAEILAIREAASRLGRWRLSDCTLYVTLEPCVMCAGALMQSRIGRCVVGALDPKAGALDSLYAIAEDPRLNHEFPVSYGVLEEECQQVLGRFFDRIRERD